MRKKINWQGYTSEERNRTIEELKNVITNNDGGIINFNMFSDLALSLSIEIPENKVDGLHQALTNFLKLSGQDYTDLNSPSECLIFLNVSFGAGRGELKIKIPEVPG